MIIPDCLVESTKRAFQSAAEEQKKIAELQHVSGYTLEELISFFAAGYTLSPPEPPKSLSELYWEDRNKW